MWVNTHLPALGRKPHLRVAISLSVLILAVVAKLLLPELPPFLTLFPAVTIGALVGGKWLGRATLLICTVVGVFFLTWQADAPDGRWLAVSLIGFVLVGGLIVFVIEQMHQAIGVLVKERQKLDLVLQAANAATWELRSNRTISWDDNFFALIGLKPSEIPPSTEQFLSMVHPEDRPRMQLARDRMNQNLDPQALDEYRLIKPDGSTAWLENRRVRGHTEEHLFIGITQDITRRKQAEQQIRELLQELGHRAKNQLTVIGKVATETRKQTGSEQEFSTVFNARMQSMARSHDLLISAGGMAVDLRTLLFNQLESFAVAHRVRAVGADLKISAVANQYFAMAFHELATNALKYGAFTVDSGSVDVAWTSDNQQFQFVWQESGKNTKGRLLKSGFGSLVLTRLTPLAVGGSAAIDLNGSGLRWELSAPISGVRA